MVRIDKTFVIFKGVHIQEHPSAWGGGGNRRGSGESPAAQQVTTDLGEAAASGACWG